MNTNVASAATALGLCLLLCGCDENVYELTLTPTRDSMERELRCWRGESIGETAKLKAFPQDELDRIAAAYGQPPPKSAEGPFQFKGTFSRTMPKDIGGVGYLTDSECPLGSLTRYTERFRGRDQLYEPLENRLVAVDELVELLDGWMRKSVGQRPDWDKLHAFTSTALRQDLRNVVLLFWVGSLNSAERFDESVSRVLLFLAERNYLRMEDVPKLGSVFSSQSPTDARRQLCRMLRAPVAAKMGVAPNAEIVEELCRVLQSATCGPAFLEYMQTTDFWHSRINEWQAAKQQQPDAPKPEPAAVMESVIGRLISLGGADQGQLRIRLACPVKPLRTNGEWDERGLQVRWSEKIHGDERLPTFAFAEWAVPQRTYQEEHFGSVLLAGDDLARYIYAYLGLEPELAREWDAFIASLLPEIDPSEKIRVFQFAGEKDGKDVSDAQLEASHAHPLRQLLLAALGRLNKDTR